MKSDADIIKAKAEIIDQNITYLNGKELAKNSSFEELQAVKHSLFVITEACIDIATHITAAEGFPRPNSYKEFFRTLNENEIIGDSSAERMAQMAGFRNFLIHRYGDVETEKLESIINENLEDVNRFLEEIYEYVDET